MTADAPPLPEDEDPPEKSGDSEETAESKKKDGSKNAGSKKGDKAQSTVVKLGKNIEIRVDKPLPEYDTGPVKAYLVIHKKRRREKFFALICEPHLAPRYRSIASYAGLPAGSLAMLESSGIVDWPPAKQERFVLIYADNLGRKIFPDEEKSLLGWRPDDMMDSVITPMIETLKIFRDREFIHGAIRASNLFDGGSAGIPKKVILGDCLCLPACYTGSAMYQTIERGAVDPIARGVGTSEDDMYAFGIMIATLMRSSNHMIGKSAYDIVKKKIEVGSYVVVTGKDRYKGALLELLRGLLHDEPDQRWTIEDVLTWHDGRRLSPKQSTRQVKAPRPIVFMERKYYYTSFLSMDLEKIPNEVRSLVDAGVLTQWLERALEDDEAVIRQEAAVKLAKEKGIGVGYAERLCSNLSVALDPLSPLRYKGLCLTIDGIGSALFETMALNKDSQALTEVISHNVALNWLFLELSGSLDAVAQKSILESCGTHLRQKKTGYGLERCLYTLFPEAPCLGGALEGYAVRSPEDMMRAFEKMSKKGEAPSLFLDRHSAAFLSVRDARVIDSFLFDLGAADRDRNVMGNLKCLATIQKRSNLPPFPAIAEAFSTMLFCVYERYHDYEIRKKLEKTIQEQVKDGDLMKMATLLDNVDLVNKDIQGFELAIKEYRLLSNEYNKLEIHLADKASFGKTAGQSVSAIISSIFSVVIILFVVFMFSSKAPPI